MSDRTATIELRFGGESVYVSWWHWTIGIVMALLLTFLIPREQSPEFANFTKGSISTTKIIAPFEFPIIKAPAVLQQEQDAAAETVLPVVVRIDSVSETSTRELMRFAKESHRMLSVLPTMDVVAPMDTTSSPVILDTMLFDLGKDKLYEQFGFELTDNTWRYLLTLFYRDRDEMPGLFSL
ncbi:MAG: hypothetical protein P9M15_02775, partial [Candidatus Electryoneaceae bacterium]|nr:hypothetical protein [Candidatus Electryoneaceae bacterium]